MRGSVERSILMSSIALRSISMRSRPTPMARPNAGQHGGRYSFDHCYEILANEPPALHAPKVQLVRLADVYTINCVASIGEPWAGDQHVVVLGLGDHAQRRRNHRDRKSVV